MNKYTNRKNNIIYIYIRKTTVSPSAESAENWGFGIVSEKDPTEKWCKMSSAHSPATSLTSQHKAKIVKSVASLTC